MALPTAQPAEVLRAWQKDASYEERLAGSLANVLPTKQASKAAPLSALLYKSFTTLKDLQTLGEEYSGIVQVDDTYHKLPSYNARLLSILFSAFGENLTKMLLKHLEKQVEKDPTLRPEAQNTFIIILKSLSNIIPQIESIHRALSYIYGGPLQIGKFITKIDYVQVRPAAAAHYAHLRLLGIVTLLHAFVISAQSIFQAKKQLEEMRDFPNEVENSKSCITCLEEMVQPCVLQCGHIFCFQCCYGVMENCALCRSPFTKNTVVPLLNYCPGSL